MQFIPRGMGEQGSDSGGSFSECVYNDTVDVSIFINSTDPDYFSQRYSYIIILLTMAGLGSCLNLGMMGCLLRLNTYRNSPLGIMVRAELHLSWLGQTKQCGLARSLPLKSRRSVINDITTECDKFVHLLNVTYFSREIF